MARVIFLLLLITTVQLQAQSTFISGTVVDEFKQAVIGANVLLDGTYDGTSTDVDGGFEFTTFEKDSVLLVISYLGMETVTQKLFLGSDNIHLDIRMKAAREMLSEVVISAGSFEAVTDKKRSPVLNPLDIVLTASSSADIAGAINMLPGTTRNGESGQILVRGGAAYETKTFIDGILVQKPYNSTIGNLPARNRFSPFLFKGTSFSTGGYSAEYGQAMSSALMLQTEDLPEKTVTGIQLLSVGGGLSHTKRWKETSLSASLSHANLAPYFALIPQKTSFDKAPVSWENDIVFRHKLNDKGSMIKFYSYTNTSDMIMEADPVFNGLADGKLRLRALNHYSNANIQHAFDNGWSMQSGIGVNYNKDIIQVAGERTNGLQSLQLRSTFSKPVSSYMNIRTGFDYQDIQTTMSQKDESNLSQDKINDRQGSVFGESEFLLSSRISGRAGLRAEYSSFLNKINLAPRATLAYAIGKNEQFSVAAGRFYQTPEYQYQFRQTAGSFESADHLIVNYQRTKNQRIFRVEAYKKWYSDLAKTDVNGQIMPATGGGYAQGLDVFFRDNKTIKNGDYWISYSYLDTKRDWKNYPYLTTPDFAMKHSLGITSKKFFPSFNMALSGSYSFHTGRPYHDPTAGGEQFLSGRTPVYQDLSATCTYLTNVMGHFTVVYLSVQNLPGFKQVYGYKYVQDPQNGAYNRYEIGPPAKRFAVLAVIMTIGEKYKKSEVTSDDY